MTDWWEGGIAGSRGGGAGGRGSVRYISYSCSFINLANLTSCSEKARAVNLIGEGCQNKIITATLLRVPASHR